MAFYVITEVQKPSFWTEDCQNPNRTSNAAVEMATEDEFKVVFGQSKVDNVSLVHITDGFISFCTFPGNKFQGKRIYRD